jgi:hypothetical protein
MNSTCYKTVFSQHTGTLVAVGEHANSNGKGRAQGSTHSNSHPPFLQRAFLGALCLGAALTHDAWAQTLPQGASVQHGSIQLNQPNANQLRIEQSSDNPHAQVKRILYAYNSAYDTQTAEAYDIGKLRLAYIFIWC